MVHREEEWCSDAKPTFSQIEFYTKATFAIGCSQLNSGSIQIQSSSLLRLSDNLPSVFFAYLQYVIRFIFIRLHTIWVELVFAQVQQMISLHPKMQETVPLVPSNVLSSAICDVGYSHLGTSRSSLLFELWIVTSFISYRIVKQNIFLVGSDCRTDWVWRGLGHLPKTCIFEQGILFNSNGCTPCWLSSIM